jgi:hypothetical protein
MSVIAQDGSLKITTTAASNAAVDFQVKNTSGVTVSVGDLGYIDAAGEYKETTTAYNDVSWCVVLVGGANNADIYVARQGRVTITLNGNCSIGDYLYTSTTAGQGQPQSYVRAEVMGVALTANTSGASGTCEALLLTGTRFVPVSTALNLYSSSTAHSGSDFVATINGAPAGAVVTYNAPSSGNENFLEPNASCLTQMRLYNSTRSNYAKIASVNLGTNAITVSSAGDIATWQSGDTITIRSQTNTGTIGAAYYVDIEIDDFTVIPELTRAIFIGQTLRDTAGAGMRFATMPWQTYDAANEANLRCQVANIPIESDGRVVTIVQRRFTLACNASGSGTINAMSSRIRGVYLATA